MFDTLLQFNYIKCFTPRSLRVFSGHPTPAQVMLIYVLAVWWSVTTKVLSQINTSPQPLVKEVEACADVVCDVGQLVFLSGSECHTSGSRPCDIWFWGRSNLWTLEFPRITRLLLSVFQGTKLSQITAFWGIIWHTNLIWGVWYTMHNRNPVSLQF